MNEIKENIPIDGFLFLQNYNWYFYKEFKSHIINCEHYLYEEIVDLFENNIFDIINNLNS